MKRTHLALSLALALGCRAALPPPRTPLTATPDRSAQRNILGEHLYPLVHTTQPVLAGKITGVSAG